MESTLRRTWAEIDLDALKNNYEKIREHVGSEVRFLGVVKADAYGHGAVQVASMLQILGADYLAVSSIDEGMELRLNGITMPILVLGHTPKEEVPKLIRNNLTQTVTCMVKAYEYSREAVNFGGNLKVHIKVDTGMSRLGYLCDGEHFENGVSGICEACELPGIKAEGIFTHFAVSDEPGDECREYTLHQFRLFMDVIDAVEDKWGKRFSLHHCANTGAVANYPQTWLDMVRPGLLLYGYGEYAEKLGLKPVMSLITTVSTVKIYTPGTHISYGGMYKTDKMTRVAVLPYGYADGFLRVLSSRAMLMTEDGPVRQIGKICMDMCMIDISEAPSVDVGSEVEVFGKHNSINTLAQMAGTIPYELTCAVSKRVPRVYYRRGEIVEKELMLRG